MQPEDYEEKGYGRYVYDSHGNRDLRYKAIDPATDAFQCTCGKPHCTRARLHPFRDHVAGLYRTLSRFSQSFSGRYDHEAWGRVLLGLQLAASIDDVYADTGYVEDEMVFALCETKIDYENARSEVASKYVAAASVFNFIWNAYEAAVSITEPNNLRKLLNDGRLGERGRRLFEGHPEIEKNFLGIQDLTRLAKFYCARGKLFDERLEKLSTRFPVDNFVSAAELCREFRNFIFHGEDEVPEHEDWCHPRGTSTARIHRFYAISRLLLYLIQALAWLSAPEAADPDDENEQITKLDLQSVQFASSEAE